MLICVLALFLVSFTFAPAYGQSQPPSLGAVQGVVLDQQDRPIGYAKVSPGSIGGPVFRRPNYVFTDELGRFLLGGLAAGRYMIYVAKEAEGYPDSASAFLCAGRPQPPIVEVKTGEVTQGVVVRTGEPGGVLVAQISDAETSMLITTASYKLYLPAKPEIYLRSTVDKPGFVDRVVPSVPFHLEVMAPGYTPWRSQTPLSIPSKSRKELSISLVRQNSDER